MNIETRPSNFLGEIDKTRGDRMDRLETKMDIIIDQMAKLLNKGKKIQPKWDKTRVAYRGLYKELESLKAGDFVARTKGEAPSLSSLIARYGRGAFSCKTTPTQVLIVKLRETK